MKRSEFIKMMGMLGLSIPFQSILSACKGYDSNSSTSKPESVLIIGAGAAGMSAGYLLYSPRDKKPKIRMFENLK